MKGRAGAVRMRPSRGMGYGPFAGAVGGTVMPTLHVIKGTNPGTVVALENGDKWVMGRNADCQIVINMPSVSREHAIIKLLDGRFFIEDLKSRNGTTVNNQEIKTRTQLNHNDRIKICDSVFAFVSPPRPELPKTLLGGIAEDEDAFEESSSTIEATLSTASKQVLLEAQPSEKLALLVEMTAELTQTFDQDKLLPKIGESLFQVFRQADRASSSWPTRKTEQADPQGHQDPPGRRRVERPLQPQHRAAVHRRRPRPS